MHKIVWKDMFQAISSGDQYQKKEVSEKKAPTFFLVHLQNFIVKKKSITFITKIRSKNFILMHFELLFHNSVN